MLLEVREKVRFCSHLRQRRRSGPLRHLPRPAPQPRARSASSRSRRTSPRSSAPASTAGCTTCSAARSARSTASGPTTSASASSCSGSPTARCTEVIIATDPNMTGEATATYLSRLLRTHGRARQPARLRPAGRRRPRVRRRGHPRPRLRGPPARRALTPFRRPGEAAPHVRTQGRSGASRREAARDTIAHARPDRRRHLISTSTDTGRGPAVVLVHGWPVTALHWRHVIPALTARRLPRRSRSRRAVSATPRRGPATSRRRPSPARCSPCSTRSASGASPSSATTGAARSPC